MHVWMLLKSELRRSLGVLGGMALVLALALSLAISTGLAERMLRSSSAQAADDFDLLVGAKGSAVSLLLGTVYLRDEPLSLVPAEALRTLKDSKRVRWYAPIALGDRIGNAAIVGTTKSMVIQGGARNVAEGRVFEAPLEAVAGAESGLKLGIQLLPGMPGSTPQRFSEDVEEALAFSPSCLRFYPCLVVDGTPLAERWRMGQYAPWELDTTITTLGKALASAWARRIPVIRLSLAPERELDESVLAGPRHPALGNIIQSEALFETVRSHFALNGFLPPDELFFPQYCQGFFSGHKGSLLPRWEKLGIQPSSIQWVEGEYASLRWNKPLEEVLS